MPSKVTSLPEELVERVLAKPGLSNWPEPTAEGLRAIYLRRRDPGSLPGDQAPDFFENWIRFGEMNS